ncbi:hypothetical protein CALVIDRAFT_171491 [Calocera viscosa TUFC12733]|uniref:Uncharacterized protein n=1 Tax=Calocera viscosa (strain TUFC12733) TaxID=1330018 RepID=A0A167L8W0_CALVF|nr:hypothetical protein CALVIDRAFT_171491 [Calocera viscosa TUFC12733]
MCRHVVQTLIPLLPCQRAAEDGRQGARTHVLEIPLVLPRIRKCSHQKKAFVGTAIGYILRRCHVPRLPTSLGGSAVGSLFSHHLLLPCPSDGRTRSTEGGVILDRALCILLFEIGA